MLWRGVQRIAAGFAVGCVSIVLLYSASLLALKVMGYEYAVVVSNSMQPIAARGDLVIVRPSQAMSLNRVVLFRRGESLVMHRLVHQNPDKTWKTRGDANSVEDPWLISRKDVVGTAFGVLRGFGVPMMLLVEDDSGAHAAFTSRGANNNSATAGFWMTMTNTWTVYANWLYFSAGASGSMTIVGSGDRKIWAGVRYPNNVRIHYEGALTRADTAGQGFALIFNACVSSTDAVSCGYQLFFAPDTKTITLRAFKSDGSLTTPLATCATNLNLTYQNTYSVQTSSGAMSFLINGVPCMRLTSMSSLLPGTGAPVPSGGFAGIRCQLSNRIIASKVHFW